MIDIKLLQKDFDMLSISLKKKGVSSDNLDELKREVDEAKIKRKEMENTQAEQKLLSNQFGEYKKMVKIYHYYRKR